MGIESADEYRRIEKILPFDEKSDGFSNSQSIFDKEF
jgi:hypothetical protein